MPYPRQHSRFWYLRRWPYRLFILRELTSVFLAGYTVLLLILVAKVHNGEGSFQEFANTLESPWLLAFHAVALLFALLHTVTWFMAVPSAVQLRRGEEKLPPQLLIGGAYATLLAASAALVALVLV